ncbi:hypothetical protein OIDMADRAFT_54933 [Oidiodendron maius Zn]|uniref:Uncharacterized protein n=1 Tax=Oidiodendron maius (strain Zn) TaxID=913774 RepID=A0A0C3GW74_OIDMZ|nr:hypothetical protein OIDMADRAFT_54933 [Oidiodendron maius Zn]
MASIPTSVEAGLSSIQEKETQDVSKTPTTTPPDGLRKSSRLITQPQRAQAALHSAINCSSLNTTTIPNVKCATMSAVKYKSDGSIISEIKPTASKKDRKVSENHLAAQSRYAIDRG